MNSLAAAVTISTNPRFLLYRILRIVRIRISCLHRRPLANTTIIRLVRWPQEWSTHSAGRTRLGLYQPQRSENPLPPGHRCIRPSIFSGSSTSSEINSTLSLASGIVFCVLVNERTIEEAWIVRRIMADVTPDHGSACLYTPPSKLRRDNEPERATDPSNRACNRETI